MIQAPNGILNLIRGSSLFLVVEIICGHRLIVFLYTAIHTLELLPVAMAQPNKEPENERGDESFNENPVGSNYQPQELKEGGYGW